MLRVVCLSVVIPVAAAQGWVDRTPTNPLTGPPPRAYAGMCWDAAHSYVLLQGGYGRYGAGSSETWTWNGTAWAQRLVTNAPTSSNGNSQDKPTNIAMAFHVPTGEVVLVNSGATYTWTGTDWLLHPVNIGTPNFGGPYNVALGHDPVRSQTVLFVGSRIANPTRTDVAETYLWDGFNWSQRPTATSPYPVDNPSIAFDPISGRLLMCTSGNGQSAYFEWNGSNWIQRLPAGAPTASGPVAADTANQRVVMFDAVMNGQPDHTWTISNGSMAQLATPLEPARRFGTAMAYDPTRGRMVLFGGSNLWVYATSAYSLLGDTWEFTPGPAASYVTYGAGCAGSRGAPVLAPSSGSLPRIGQNFQVNVGNLPFTGPVFLFVGLSDATYGPTPLPFPLAALGAPGCSVLSSGEDLHLLTNVLGSAMWQWTIPNFPGTSFYNQAFAFDPAANALGLTTSNGGHAVIGM